MDGRLRLHANVARFQRLPVNKVQNDKGANGAYKFSIGESSKANGNTDRQPSYVGVVKQKMMYQQPVEDDNKPSLVLDDSCVLQCDYSLSLMRKVLDFGSLSNLKMVLTKEGFKNFNLKYLGGFWVLIEFCSKQALEKFKSHVGVVPLKVWTNNTFNKISSKWGGMLFEEDKENVCLNSKRVCIKTKLENNIFESFKIIVNRKVFWIRAKEVCGWVPDFLEDEEGEDESDDETLDDKFRKDNSKANMNFNSEGDSDRDEVSKTIFSPHQVESKQGEDIIDDEEALHSDDPFKIYDLLKKVHGNNTEDKISNVTLKYPPGFTPMEDIDIKTDQVDKLNGEEKEYNQNVNEQVNDVEEISNRGGILCVWDPRMFHKYNSTVSDYFVAIQGDWIPNAKKCLIISVYAPQEFSEKRMLWYYLNHVLDNWSGETIIMGDFNEVRGLVEVSLGGCAFTWCHKSGNKMSKLDRFLISFTWSNSTISYNNAIAKFMKKLKYLKEQIRLWVRAKKESECMQRSNLKGMLTDIDLLIDDKKVDRVLVNKRSQVMNSLYELEKLESMEIAQKAKIKWSIKGDENSKYFHIKNEFLSHFKERFKRPCSSRLMLDMTYPNRLNSDQIDDLERNVTKEEIKRAMWDCGIDKSPGPDGFTFGFYRRYWDIIEKNVVDAVSYLFTEGTFPKGGNASFIALIPKMQDAKVVKDYRPISLIGSMYKIIAKILANHLVVVLGDLVNEVQSAFIANRQILDGPFILNELIHWCKSKKKQTMIFKIDFEKAYDSVRWDYLDDVLNKFGFGTKWRGWIHNCLHSSKGSILVNESPTGEFHFRRGLKQDCFHKASGLRMNFHKSKLMVIAVEDEKVSRAAMKMGCCTLKTPFSYPGIKVGGTMSRIKYWDEIVANLHSRLSKWKMKTLSIGG
ncbi:RNA-directed DNA polymerase, eukaryota [Tanacetum coccineum]